MNTEIKFILECLQVRSKDGKEVLYTSPSWPRMVRFAFPRESEIYLGSDEKENPLVGIAPLFTEYYAATCAVDNPVIERWAFSARREHASVWSVLTDIEVTNFSTSKHKDFFLRKLNGEKPEDIREFFPQAYYLVTRSYKPEGKTPWKRVANRTYMWCVPLEERNADRGRRIEWGGDTVLYATRKEALNALYNNK